MMLSPLATQVPGESGPTIAPRTLPIEKEMRIEPRAAVKNPGHVGATDREDARAGVVMPQRANRGRRHHDIADPVR